MKPRKDLYKISYIYIYIYIEFCLYNTYAFFFFPIFPFEILLFFLQFEHRSHIQKARLFLGEEKETGEKENVKFCFLILCVEKEITEFFNFGFACALKILRLELQKL